MAERSSIESAIVDYTGVTVATVEAATAEALAQAALLVNQAAAAANGGTPTFESTLRPLDAALDATAIGYGRGAFLGNVHPDRAVRDAGNAAEEALAKWRVELPFRTDVYELLLAFATTAEASALTGERAQLLEHWLREFRRAGQNLSAAKREELRQLQSRLVEIEVAFNRNIGEFADHLELTRAELDGLSDDYVAGLKPGSRPDTWQVSLDYPEVVPFMEQARRRDLREELEFHEWTQAVELNRPLLAEALAVRRQIAALLGYDSWAHYAIEVRMAGEPAAVRAFYDSLVPPLRLKAAGEFEVMTAALKAETGDDQLHPWDFRYYDTQLRRTTYGVDAAEVAAYFPLERVMAGMLDLTAEVFGLEYRKIPDARAWHPDVELYEIRDSQSGETLAYAYTDLFPREGKFSHAAAFPLVVAHRGADGRRVRPVSAIVANLTKPSGDRPSLLRHDEVLTLFHEFGHILHMSLSQAEFVRFSGASTESDFVEAPSQIMEHWSWNADVLRRFARHYQTQEPIPVELVDQLVAARNLNVAIRLLRQAYFGTMDLAFHGEIEPVDFEAIDRASYEVTGLPFHEGTFFAASFGHLLGGYDAGYYGYLWSRVFGDDMFSRFEAEGITNSGVGTAYRREILEPNGAAPGDELLRRFLGREPNNEAFLRQIGLIVTPA